VNATDVVLVLATTAVGITTGVMFCYQIAIMPALHELSDREFINSFQHIDRQIVNPLFVVVSFLGGGALLLTGTVLEAPGSVRFLLLVAASAVYIVGVVIVTLVWHVPRNAALDRFAVTTATDDEFADARKNFEPSWNRLHAARTLASIAALVVLSVALVETGTG
jgi:uncharacterized membrane protein